MYVYFDIIQRFNTQYGNGFTIVSLNDKLGITHRVITNNNVWNIVYYVRDYRLRQGELLRCTHFSTAVKNMSGEVTRIRLIILQLGMIYSVFYDLLKIKQK